MIFVFKKWEDFCKKLSESGMQSVSAKEIASEKTYLVLKHDVETDVKKAYRMAEIEQKYGHRGSYYVQGYLMNDPENIRILTQMQQMGHEISYHYDVMDSNKGDIKKAILEFEENKKRIEDNGFELSTVCQHGNPIVERIGYHSNRDFFRNEKVQKKYPQISDIMVNFKTARQTDYIYYSDAGRKFKMIFDPINNDIVNSDDKNVVYKNLDEVLLKLSKNTGTIISIHPHRWTKSAAKYIFKTSAFKVIRFFAKILSRIPIFKKFMSRYYYLAKKI
ncbi:MAG: hypothetical protein J6D52_11775 [Clostridia bacterium]|nr:hypothetical protein [Clostridia bacterium]